MRRIAFLSLTCAGVFWGLGFPLAKLVLREIDAPHMVLLRLSVAALAALPFTLRPGARRLLRSPVVILGGCLYGTAFLLQFEGLARVTVTLAALIVGVQPALIAITAWLTGERISRFIPGCSPPNVWSARDKVTGEVVGEVRLDVYGEPQPLGLLWLDAIATGDTIVYCPMGETGPGRLIKANTALFDPTMSPEEIRAMSRKITDAEPGVFEAVGVKTPEAISRALGDVVMVPATYHLDQFMMLYLRRTMVEIPGFPKLGYPVDAPVAVKGRELI